MLRNLICNFYFHVSHCLMKGSWAQEPARNLYIAHGWWHPSSYCKTLLLLKTLQLVLRKLALQVSLPRVIMCFLLYLPCSLEWLFCGISDSESGKPITTLVLWKLLKGPDLLSHAEAHFRYATPSGVAGTLYRRMYSCISGKLCLT